MKKRLSFHSSYFFLLVLCFFVAISIPALYRVTFMWSVTLFLFSILMGLKIKNALQIILITFLFSYSVFLLFLFFPGHEYKTGGNITILGFTFFKKAFEHALSNWLRLWAISLFSLSSAKVLDGEELILYGMQRNVISKRLGYSLLMGLNSISGFVDEWKQVSLNLKLRGIKTTNPFKRIFPLLVYAFRSSLRGAMALRARGLKETKTFYLTTAPKRQDLVILVILIFLLLAELVWVYAL